LRHGFDGVEAFNTIADWQNGKSSGAFHWDRMLDRNPGAVGPAVDFRTESCGLLQECGK
jgi:hypothetical protein